MTLTKRDFPLRTLYLWDHLKTHQPAKTDASLYSLTELKMLQECMDASDYRMAIYCFGIDLVRGMLEYFEIEEHYEDCQKIKQAIEKHNEMCNDNLETTPYATTS